MSTGRQILISSGIEWASEGVALVSGVVVARLMGPTAIGTIAAAMAILSMFRYLGNLGLGTAHTKYISEGRDIGRCMGIFVPLDGAISFLAVAAGLGAYWVRARFSSAPSEIPLGVMSFVALGYLFNQLSAIPNATFLGLQNIVKRDAPRLISQLVSSTLRIGVAVAGAGVIGLAVSDAIAAFTLLALYLWLIRGIPISKPDRDTFKSYLAFGVFVLGSGMIVSLVDPLDRVLLQARYELALVGIYATALRLASPFSRSVSRMGTIFFPRMSQVYARDGVGGVQGFMARAERRMAILAFPLCIAAIPVVQPLVVLLLGEQFAGAGPVLALIILQAVLEALIHPYWQLTAAADKKMAFFTSTALSQGLKAALLFVFIYDLGGISSRLGGPLVGAAMALTGATFCQIFLFRWIAARSMSIQPNWRILIHLVSGIGFAALAGFTVYSLGWTSLIGNVFVGLGLGSLHVATLYLAGEFNGEDIAFFRDTFNLKKMTDFVWQGAWAKQGKQAQTQQK